MMDTKLEGTDVQSSDVQRLCGLAGIARSSYYRCFEDHAPREADTDLLGQIQVLSLRYRFYGSTASQLNSEGRAPS